MLMRETYKIGNLLKWQIMLSILLIAFGAMGVNSIYAQKAKLVDKIPKRLPIKVEFEKAETEDLLATIDVKITNKGRKPIYFVLLDIVPTDITDNEGLKFSFRLMYGRKNFHQLSEFFQSDDDPLLPGESYLLKIDSEVLQQWNLRLTKDGKPKPKHFDINFRHLSYGDGSGFMGKPGHSFSGRFKRTQNGEFVKRELSSQNPLNKKGTTGDSKEFLANSVSAKLAKIPVSTKDCQNKSKDITEFFVKAKFTSNLFSNFTPNSAKSSLGNTLLDCQDCPDTDCEWRKPAEYVCCRNLSDPNAYVPSWDSAPCDDPDTYCSTPEYYAEPYYCQGGGPTVGLGCYGQYLEYCDQPPLCIPEICGNNIDDDCDGSTDEFCPVPGGNGGGSGGGCTQYYWVQYISYDGGQTWQIDPSFVPIYAGCW